MIACLVPNKFLHTWCLSLSLLSASTSAMAQTQWQKLAPHLDYAVVSPNPYTPWGQLHAFRFSLKNYQLKVALAKDFNRQSSSIQYLAKHTNALVAVNGGFFTPQMNPIGLRISGGKKLQKIQNTSWWGIFYVRNQRPYLSTPTQFPKHRRVDFAIQGGPRLLINGQIPKLKKGLAERTAICSTRSGQVVLIASDKLPLETDRLASIISKSSKNNGFDCFNALNLDGGNSTQLNAIVGNFSLSIRGFSSITDAVYLTPKS